MMNQFIAKLCVTVCLLVFAVGVVLPNHATAAELGIIAVPEKLSEPDIGRFIAMMDMLKRQHSAVNLALLGGSELEPTAGDYTNVKEKLGGYNYMGKTLAVGTNYFGVNLINTTRRDISSDLETTPWTSPLMLQRFVALLSQITKEIQPHVTQFILGNEIDVYFEKHPDELDGYLAFYHAAEPYLRQAFPGAKLGMSVTFEGLHKGRQASIAKIIAASDAAFVTFYPQGIYTDGAISPAVTGLDDIIAAAQGKDVYLQEVGYPSASSPPGLTPEMQAEFFRTIIPAINQRDQIKMAAVFAMHDIDGVTCDRLTGYYGFAGAPKAALEGFRTLLCSLGLRDANGKPKPAWDAVVTQLKP